MIRIVIHEIKNYICGNTKIFILSVFALMFSCIAINITLTNYLHAKELEAAMTESYGNKHFFKIIINGGEDVFDQFFDGSNVDGIRDLFEHLKEDKLIDFRYTTSNGIEFYNDGIDYDSSLFPIYPQQCVDGYEDGNPAIEDNYIRLKGLYVDSLFDTEKNISLESGLWFKDDDFIIDDDTNITLPVIMGSEYKDYYKIGDNLNNAHIGTENIITLKVIGFLTEDSYFYDNNNDKCILNRYLLVPAVEVSDMFPKYDDDGAINSFYSSTYDSLKIMNSRIICDDKNVESVKKNVNGYFAANQLYELRLSDETEAARKELSEFNNISKSCFGISLIVISFSFIVYAIQLYYKLLRQRKKYSVLLTTGIRKRQIFWISVADTMVVFTLADVMFLIFWIINYQRGFDGLGLTPETFLIIPVLEILMMVCLGLYSTKQTYKIDLSSSLRENE